MLLEALHDGARRGLRLTFTDKGPGIADIARALRTATRPAPASASAWAAPSGCPTSSTSRPRPGRARGCASRAGSDGDAGSAPLPDRRSQSGRRGAPPRRGAGRRAGLGEVPRRSWHSSSASSGRISSSTRAAATARAGAAASGGARGPGARQGRRHGERRGVLSRRPLDRGSAGTGLGAVRRLASFVDVYSRRPGGTAIVARVGARRLGPGGPALGGRRVCVLAKAGEEVCGDGWAAAEIGDGYQPDDGGRAGAWTRRGRCRARGRAVLRGRDRPSARPRRCRRSITRSAARAAPPSRWCGSNRRAGVVRLRGRRQYRRLDRRRGAARASSCPSTAPPVTPCARSNEFTYPWTDDALLVVHTDGLVSRWDLDRYPGLCERHPSLVAGVLYPRLQPRARRRDGRRRTRARRMSVPLLTMAIRYEHDVVAVRQRARQVAAAVGFDGQDQTRIATAISELARNAFMYARGGAVEFLVEGQRAPQLLSIRVSDRGPGIADVDAVLSGRYRSRTGMGLGHGGRTAPRRPVRGHVLARAGDDGDGRQAVLATGALLRRRRRCGALGATLARPRPQSPIEEIRQQNQELIARARAAPPAPGGAVPPQRRARGHQPRRRRALRRARREGGHAAARRRAQVALSVEHEPRVPHAAELDAGAVGAPARRPREPARPPEQRRQVGYIRQAADDLSELVNDLLDLATVEAGKTVVRPAEFDLRNLFAALRGMLRPLLVNESVALVFEEPEDVPPLAHGRGRRCRRSCATSSRTR